MATDFAVCLQRFLTSHLPGCADAHEYDRVLPGTFKLLIASSATSDHPPDKLTLDHIDAAAITGSWTGWRPNGTTASQPATSGWPAQLVLPLAAVARPCPMAAARTSSPSGQENTSRREPLTSSRPPSARRARPVHPAGRRDATLLATSTTPPPGFRNSPTDVRDIRCSPALAVLTARRKTRHVRSAPTPPRC